MNKLLNHEKVIELMHNSAQNALDVFEEPAAIIIGVVWQQKLGDDLPAGIIVYRKEQKPDLNLLFEAMKQITKLATGIINGLRATINEGLKQLSKSKNVETKSVQSSEKKSNDKEEATGSNDSGPYSPGTK